MEDPSYFPWSTLTSVCRVHKVPEPNVVLTSTALMTWSREGPSWSLDRDVWAVFGLKLRLRLSSSIHDVIADFWRRTSGVRWRLNGMLVFALRCKQDAHFFSHFCTNACFPDNWSLVTLYIRSFDVAQRCVGLDLYVFNTIKGEQYLT